MSSLPTVSDSPVKYSKQLFPPSPEVIKQQPADPIPLSSIESTLLPFFATRLHFFYSADKWVQSHPNSPPLDHFMSTAILHKSLQKLLEFYPIVAARFLKPTRTGDIASLTYQGSTGVPFEEGFSNEVALSEFPLQPEQYGSMGPGPYTLPQQVLRSLLPPFNYADPLSDPPFQVRLTRFKCGGVCLAVHLQHYISDGQAFFQLLKDWASLFQQCQRGEDMHLDVIPNLDRTFLTSTPEQLAHARQVGAKRVDSFQLLSPESAHAEQDATAPTKTCRARVFRFRAQELENMKKAASPTDGKGWVSTFEAIVAHIARCMYRARNPDAIESTVPASSAFPVSASAAASDSSSTSTSCLMDIDIVTNLRGRLPTIPDDAKTKRFCNVVLPTRVRLTPDTLMISAASGGLRSATAVVHKTLQSGFPSDPRYKDPLNNPWYQLMAWLSVQERKDTILQTVPMHTGFIMSAWNKFSVYSTAFEPSIKPMRVCLPTFEYATEGLLYVLDCEEEGAVDIGIGLQEEHMKRMETMSELRSFQS